MTGMLLIAAALLNPTVELECRDRGEWKLSVEEREAEPGVRIVKVSARAPKAAPVPRFRVAVHVPAVGCDNAWDPNFGCGENITLLPWWGKVFNIARTQPLRVLFDRSGTNRMALAVGELRRTVTFDTWFDEGPFACSTAVNFFTEPSEPLDSYETEIRLDMRGVPFCDAVRAAARWQSARAGMAARPPEAAYEALYSTWYGFHKDLRADVIEDECRRAAALGMKTIILDDGWQCDDTDGGYASCGDWRISTKRFPDMRGHVARVHALGMKYVVWFSMPFVGEETEAYPKFKDKMLRRADGLGAWVLDPRFPEVRAYLRDVYLRCLRDWDIDGFKLDFVDSFGLEGGKDPAVAQNYAGRDCRSIPDGVEKLLKEVTDALRAEKPDVLLEFRQAYVGPEIRRYGNMVRVGDCPGSPIRNRVHIANLRLLCEGTAVHADMLRWNEADTLENAQWLVLNSIFGVVQYSVVLSKASEEEREMLARWIRFAAEHREALLKGRLTAHRPELNYPVIESESDSERIVVIYDPTVAFDLGPITKPTYVIDATTGKISVVGKADADGNCRFSWERRLDGWDSDTYVMLPAAAYDGNRAFVHIAPPEGDYGAWYRPSDFGSGKCPYTMHEKIPALAPDNSGVLEGSSGDLAAPCAAFFFPKAKKGAIIWFQPQVKGRDAGYRLENGVFRVEYPARRKELLFKASDEVDPPIACAPGETLRACCRVDEFACEDVAGLYAEYFRRRRSFVSGERAATPPAEERRRLANLVAGSMVKGSIREVPDQGRTWSSGWCGGPMNVAALVAVGWPDAGKIAASTLDFMADTIEPCGFFRGLSRDGKPVRERFALESSEGLLLTRRAADGLFWAEQILDAAAKAPGSDEARQMRREKALKRCADAFCELFDRYGELPQYIDRVTGESRIAGSTSAAMAPAALVRMYVRFGDRRYLDYAAKIADQMCREYLSRGLSFGGPGDAADACDSESIYALLESCVSLAERHPDRAKWIARAKDAANLLSTWVVPYAYEFPADSEYGRRGVNTVGSVIANLQNRHAAPGFCTASGDALSRLAALSGDMAYLEMFKDVIAFFPQVIATPERPIRATLWTDEPRNLESGWINERVNMSGWEGLKGVGEVFPGPCWSDLSFLLSPGLVD